MMARVEDAGVYLFRNWVEKTVSGTIKLSECLNVSMDIGKIGFVDKADFIMGMVG